MPRPQRNRIVLLSTFALAMGIGAVLPHTIALSLLSLVLGLAAVSYLVSWQYFAARRAMRRKQWVDALKKLEAYEQSLQTPWRKTMSFLALGIYSLDGVAIARNNVGVVHLENEQLQWAKTAFESAVAKDPLYAVPHVNLAVVAAKQKDRAAMERELENAAKLGVQSPKMTKRISALL